MAPLFPVETFTFKLLESALTTLSNDGNESLMTNATGFKSAFSEACTSIDASSKDLTNIKIALISFAALAEIDHYTQGKDGVNLGSLVATICSHKTNVKKIKSAKGFLKQAANQIGIGKEKTPRALELLKEVHKTATKARSVYEVEQKDKLLQEEDDASQILDDLVTCTKILILADLLIDTLEDTSYLIPFKKMDADKRRSIIVNTISHVEEMMLSLEEHKVDDGKLMSIFTNSWDKIGTLVDLYISCVEWVTLHSLELEDGRVQLTLPILKLILDATTEHKVARAKIASPVKTTISIWLQSYENRYRRSTEFLLNLCLDGNIFRVYFEDKGDHELNYNTQVELTFADKKVVAVYPEDNFDEGKIGWVLADTYDIRKFHESWPSSYIHALAFGLASGEIENVDEMKLRIDDNIYDKYRLAEIEKMIECLPAVNKLRIRMTDLPEDMELQHWKAAADLNTRMEFIQLDFNNSYESTIGEGCEYELGRLVTRAKMVAFKNIQTFDMALFFEGAQQGLGEEAANCEQMYFHWSTNKDIVEMFKENVEKMGWIAEFEHWEYDGKLYMNAACIKMEESISFDKCKNMLDSRL